MENQEESQGQDLLREPRETDYLISNSSRPSSSQNRRPYYYSPYGVTEDASINSTSDAWSERANYSRYLYYSRLRREALEHDDDVLLIPPHVIPTSFFYPPFITTARDGKQSSIITIFTIWNTMCGTSLLRSDEKNNASRSLASISCMPWGIERAGLVPSIFLLLGMAAISFYTAYRILEVYENNESSKIQDFAVLCKRLLGRWAQVLAILFSVFTLLGASIVYWVLMSNFLFNTVDLIYTATISDVSPFHGNETDIFCPTDNVTLIEEEVGQEDLFHEIWVLHRTVPLFLVLLLGPIICIRSPTFFAKFNSLGTMSVIYIMIFVFSKLLKHGVNISFDATSPSYTPLYKPNFPALAGMLSLSYFIHNCIVTIMRNNRNPSNNKRDLGISFLFVALTYFLIGGLFYLVFPLEKMCIQDNFLNNFRSYDVWSFAARIFLFFQILTVYPLLVYILRVQTLGSNVIIMAICVSFSIWLPQIGTIIRFTGAICGLVYSFFLPVALYLRWKKNLNSLSNWNLFFHISLFMVGLINFIAQFFVSQ